MGTKKENKKKQFLIPRKFFFHQNFTAQKYLVEKYLPTFYYSHFLLFLDQFLLIQSIFFWPCVNFTAAKNVHLFNLCRPIILNVSCCVLKIQILFLKREK